MNRGPRKKGSSQAFRTERLLEYLVELAPFQYLLLPAGETPTYRGLFALPLDGAYDLALEGSLSVRLRGDHLEVLVGVVPLFLLVSLLTHDPALIFLSESRLHLGHGG